MRPKALNNFLPEVLFVAEGYDYAEKVPATDVVSKRGSISSALASLNTGGVLKPHEVVDIQSVITEFLHKLEASGKFIVTDENGALKGVPKEMSKKLSKEIYRKTLIEIKQIYKFFLPEVTISELFDDISSIDVIVDNEEIIDISIFPK
jgi:hypothetical protein